MSGYRAPTIRPSSRGRPPRDAFRYAYERVDAGEPMPGVFEVDVNAPLGAVIEDLELLALCSLENEWSDRVGYVPLR